ncbi:hypothetical protein SAMN04487936_103398 [Halobacillus dabanensis]|uniref:Uncharacterized protein n=1 Tax=Halobacillus dabanensis TaxID=240302 RepID=A0A1I3TIX0_HALDA|nr:hypothetical protein [Halobacillus dabanensis]SFJ70453.1 hypothetical protein SAMN04487936_103398 [Halobacillus dabanensis]
MKGTDKPFNDVIAHKQNVEGYPGTSRGKLPLPIKLLGYILFGSFILTVVIGVFGIFIAN